MCAWGGDGHAEGGEGQRSGLQLCNKHALTLHSRFDLSMDRHRSVKLNAISARETTNSGAHVTSCSRSVHLFGDWCMPRSFVTFLFCSWIGLGLTIVRRIIQSWKGILEV
jgi:hypothetical protein